MRRALLLCALLAALVVVRAHELDALDEEFDLDSAPGDAVQAARAKPAWPVKAAVSGAQSFANVVAHGITKAVDGQAKGGDYVAPQVLSPADLQTIEVLRLQWDALLAGRVQSSVNSRTEIDAAWSVANARDHHAALHAAQHGTGGIKWKDLVLAIRKHETAVTDAFKAFQTAIATAMQAICNRPPVTCRALGKTDLTSDFDVMIEGRDMQANLNAELAIEWMLTKTFLRDTFFWTNPAVPSFDLKRVLEFFDINFYLANFGLKRIADAPADRLASYYLTTDFRGQLPYAFAEDKPFAEKTLDVYHRKAVALVSLQRQVLAAGPAATQPQINALVQAHSDLSLYQDESYHTQGTLFHVVYMLQGKTFFLDAAEHRAILFDFYRLSVIENLMMAKVHTGKQKYMYRVVDAMSRIETMADALGADAKAFLGVLYAKIPFPLRATLQTESTKPDVYAAFEQNIPALLVALRAHFKV